LRSAIVCEERAVTALYAVGSVISIAILVYLFIAMLKPEWF